METTEHTNTSSPDQNPIIGLAGKPNRKKLIIILVVALTIAATIAGYVYWQNSNRSDTSSQGNIREGLINNAITNGRFPADQKIAQVGNETLYGRDLNYVLAVNYPEKYQDQNISDEELKKLGVPILATGSAILQGSSKTDPNVYNNAQKDIWARERLIQELTQAYLDQELSYSGSMITIWYHNIRPPKVSIAGAERIAKTKIDNIHRRLTNKSLTMEQAANEIKNDTQLAQLDYNYVGNAQTKFVNGTRTQQPFTFQELNVGLFSLQQGQISPVIKVPANIPIGQAPEEFYAIISADQITNQNNQTLDSWVKEQLNKYQVIIF